MTILFSFSADMMPLAFRRVLLFPIMSTDQYMSQLEAAGRFETEDLEIAAAERNALIARQDAARFEEQVMANDANVRVVTEDNSIQERGEAFVLPLFSCDIFVSLFHHYQCREILSSRGPTSSGTR
jgi:hypothetical protein